MKIDRFLPLLVVFALSAGCKPPGPAVAPDPALADQLADAREVNGYLVRPPKGYPETTGTGGPPGAKVVAWGGTQRGDGTAPMFQVLVGTPPANEKMPSQDEFLTLMLDGIKKRRTDWTQQASERVTVNGIPFVRARWSGTDKEKGRKMHGVMYAAIDGRTVITLSTQDFEPHHEKALPLGEAAAQTFQKK